jgi:hypothetical protein
MTQATLNSNLAKTQKALNDQLASDINTRLGTDGGTLSGDLKVKGKLEATSQLTVQGVTLTGDDITALLGDLTNYNNPNEVTAAQVGLGNVMDVAQVPLSYLDTDPTLSADSDSRVPSQKAVKSYVDGQTVASNLWQLSGNVISPKNPAAILGLGSNTLTLTGNAYLNQDLRTSAAPTFSGLTLANALTVSNGGTGAESFSSNYLLRGNGTGALESSLIYDNGTSVGIGTTNPGSKLSVSGGGLALGSAYAGFVAGDGNAIISGNVGIGTTNPTHALEVTGDVEVSGNFIQNGTNLTVPDYVFQPNYNLMSLAYLQTYVNTNSHLPGVPSEADIQKNGLNTGTMILDLLQQTEQNVLYIIGNHNDIQSLSQLVAADQTTEASAVANLQTQLSAETQNIASLEESLNS